MSDQQEERRVVRLQVLVTEEELELIEDWRFCNRAESRAAAVRELIKRGLERAPRPQIPRDAPTFERAMWLQGM